MLGGIRKFELNRRQEKEDRRILELENKRKTDELEQARSLQLSMLPKEVPSLSGIDISVYMKTATEVGGDYYDFYLADSGELTTIIGDATGHGLNAGMLVSVTKGMFQNLASQSELEKIISQFNTALISMELQPMYMSLSLIRITNNRLQVVGAGMPPFLYYQAKSKIITEIESSGPPLGGLPGFIYQICNYELSKGDVIVMMSDGFAERRNANKEVYGWEKGKELLTNISHLGSEQIIEELVKAGDEWGGDRQQDDDITFVVIKIK
jgi:serine phosphatase RsbU (regulator of sigma subunit)